MARVADLEWQLQHEQAAHRATMESQDKQRAVQARTQEQKAAAWRSREEALLQREAAVRDALVESKVS